MESDDFEKSLLEQYTELSKNSLIKVQYSCGGNLTNIDEPEAIPIVPDDFIPDNTITYKPANDENAEAIVKLLKTNNLPTSDLGSGQRLFFVALSAEETIGCVAIEVYEEVGLLRSLAVQENFRGTGIGQKLVREAENWSRNNGLKELYLLTTTAAVFFQKLGWYNAERTSVPMSIASSSEFASICPATAICMHKAIA